MNLFTAFLILTEYWLLESHVEALHKSAIVIRLTTLRLCVIRQGLGDSRFDGLTKKKVRSPLSLRMN